MRGSSTRVRSMAVMIAVLCVCPGVAIAQSQVPMFLPGRPQCPASYQSQHGLCVHQRANMDEAALTDAVAAYRRGAAPPMIAVAPPPSVASVLGADVADVGAHGNDDELQPRREWTTAGIALLAVGALAGWAWLIGSIMLLVAAFRVSIGWGLASIIIPFAQLVFVARHYQRVRKAFWVTFWGGAVSLAAVALAIGLPEINAGLPGLFAEASGASAMPGAMPGAMAATGRAVTPEPSDTLDERTGHLTTLNTAGRSGAYYIPPRAQDQPVPVLVALHGTGGSGDVMVNFFRDEARSRAFAIVAPSSRRTPSGAFSWEVGDQPGDVTEDMLHTLACLEEVVAMLGSTFDRSRVLIAGHSGGASSAPYIATNRAPFAAFAVLHGGVFQGGLGRRPVRGWFSTGASDTMRTPSMVRAAMAQARGAGVSRVQYREFAGGHGILDDERRALIDWWLGPS